MLKENDYVNFYYNSGLYLGSYLDAAYGYITPEKKVKVIGDFKRFIESRGGVERFTSSRVAVMQFLNKISQGVKYGRKRR